MLSLLRFIFLMLLISEFSVPVFARARPQSALDAKANLTRTNGQVTTGAGIPIDLSKKNVLLLHAYTYETASSLIMDPIFVKGFVDAGLGSFNLHFEFLDLTKHPDPKHRSELVRYLSRKFEKHPINVIIVLHSTGLSFLTEEGKGLFRGIPVINVIADSEFIYSKDFRSAYERRMHALNRPFVIMPELINADSTMESILSLQPDTRTLVVISGSSLLDRRMEQTVRHSLRAWQGRLRVEYLSGLPLEEVLKRVSTVAPKTAILISNFTNDPGGRAYSPPEVVRKISRAANAPVFGLFDTLLGNGGIVGGIMKTHRDEAVRAVRLAVEILLGKLPTEPVTILPANLVPLFDWEQLNRSGLKENRLPPGSIVLNRPKTLWSEHKGLVIGGIAVLLAQAVLVIGLLIQRHRKVKAEDSLRHKTQELDQFFNITLDLLDIANIDGYFLRLNPAWERTLGYTREELMAKRFFEFVHPDDLDRTRKAISTLTSQQKVHSFENRYRCKDGTYRWLQWSSAPAGKLIYAAARDITEHKRGEEDLKKSEERFRMLVETMNEGFGVRNEYGIWTYVNDQLCWMLGYLSGDIVGRPVAEFLDQSNQRVLEEEIQKQRKRNYSPYEITWTRRDGRKVTTIVSPKPIFNPEGQLKEVFSVITDITERKEAEEALRQSEERFRQVAENVGGFIWEIDANGLYRYTSPSVEKILGYRPDELVGKKHFYDLFAPDVREELKTAAFKVIAAKESFRALPNPNLSKDGKVVHLETSGVPVLDEIGNLVGYRGADTDVTERKRAEEELRRHQEHLEESVRERTAELVMARDEAEIANRAKSTFLANMSHELRTPLNSILGIAQLMERDAGFPDQQRETLKVLSRSGAHLLELINDVLELSKIEAGKMTADITSFDLRSFLGDLEEMIRLRAVGKGLTLRFEYEAYLPRSIETDVRKLRQILINLLGNAIKYTEKGGVTLRTRFKEGVDTTPWGMPSSKGRLEFEIEDTGIGIAPEDMQRIFEPFVQVNPGRTVRDGTGLGLTLSRMFVELLGGEITIRSQVGRGSTFAFDIAVKLVEVAAVHTEEADRQVIGLMPGQPPYRFLVVDDSPENRFVLRRLLERVGFSVVEAATGQEAVDLYKNSQPHLIWMDLRMPALDGNEAARRIREAESGRRNGEGKEMHTPIIALTAGVMGDERIPSHSRVFDGWVFKPFQETEIFEKLEKHLGVQFLCRSSVRSAVDAESTKDGAALMPADLSILSADWLSEFSRALRKGHSTELLGLIDRIPPERVKLAGALAGLVRVHQFDKLIAVTEGALRGNSNG